MDTEKVKSFIFFLTARRLSRLF